MKLNFTKMHGCGNDYIYVNGFETNLPDPETVAIRLSRRHFSVGSDGLIMVCPSSVADVRMRMFNADGSEGKMCGNGIRCVARYAYDSGICKKNPLTVETLAGIKTITLSLKDGEVESATVDMGKPEVDPKKVPVLSETPVIGKTIQVGGDMHTVTCVSMGNPHCVIFVTPDFDLWNFDIRLIGSAIENDPFFPEKVNVEFAKKLDSTHFEMRVWERGSGETYACGTGACATVAAAIRNGLTVRDKDISVILRGGCLTICETTAGITLTGEAEYAFTGSAEV